MKTQIKLSQDYERLFELIEKGHQVVCYQIIGENKKAFVSKFSYGEYSLGSISAENKTMFLHFCEVNGVYFFDLKNS